MALDRCVLPAHQRPFEVPELGHPVLDRYLVFVAARCRPNTVLAAASDLRAFFTIVAKEPDQVDVADVLGFIHQQRRPRGSSNVLRLSEGESGLSSRTIQRRLSTVSGLFSWLLLLEEISKNPVPRGLSTRRQAGRRNGVPLIRTPRTLPQILEPAEVDALLRALMPPRPRDHTDREVSQQRPELRNVEAAQTYAPSTKDRAACRTASVSPSRSTSNGRRPPRSRLLACSH
jgi:site-specific recombinase XerC